jgi:hypothetical protein
MSAVRIKIVVSRHRVATVRVAAVSQTAAVNKSSTDRLVFSLSLSLSLSLSRPLAPLARALVT